MSIVPLWQLRARFAERLAAMYATEVPAYQTLVDVAQQVNADVVTDDPQQAARLGSIERVTAERHGAIRVGNAHEVREAGRVFAGLGMSPVGYYDLRDGPGAVPVVSTAFRPVDADELARNPFRVFTSVLTSDDRRFFDRDLQVAVDEFLRGRTLFGGDVLALADRAAAEGGLPAELGDVFVASVVSCFALSQQPVDAQWYRRLEAVSSVAADIAGERSTHINHLTPRVLDIDLLYTRMARAGIEMIDEVQGPPRWAGPDLLLRQTSFRALAEPRLLRSADDTVSAGRLRVRFGEVEQRGIAVTPAGRDLVDELQRLADETGSGPAERAAVAAAVWDERMPRTERALLDAGLAYFTVRVVDARRSAGTNGIGALLDRGAVVAEPIVYEDFLPRSAAGIFRSNLTADGRSDATASGSVRDIDWLAGALERPVHVPERLYQAQQDASLDAALRELDGSAA